jgi:colanic acid/amylovoran biosynthesis glycosyltransferase
VRVAYLVSRFPKLSETFIVDEILALERLGVEVALYSLARTREPVAHPEARALAHRCRIASPLAPALWLAQLAWLARAPRALLGIWSRVLLEHWRSPRLLARSIAALLFASLHALHMQRSGIAHVHAHWATHPALAAWVVHRLTGLPYSFTAHADDLFVQQSMLREKARRAAFVVAISEYNRRFLVDRLGAAAPQIEVVHCGVATAALRPRPDTEGAPFRIACVARLEEKKGQARLVDACAALARRGVDFYCDLVGEGRDRMALSIQIAALGLSDRVVLHGPQPRARVLEIISAADAVVLPGIVTATGRRDGIPVALMEAMALARAVVASPVSGVPELVEHERSGLLVDPEDVESLADALARLAGDAALRARLGAAGRRRIEADFELDRSAARLSELFRSEPPRARPMPGVDCLAVSEVSG